jgi:phospholipase/carboxylesterase
MSNEFTVVEPSSKADAAVIWLHGLGADSSDFVGIVDYLRLPPNHKVRFIFPNAPHRSITINNGMRMRAWYDIFDLSMVRKEDQQGIADSEKILLGLIQQELDCGIPSERIILAGFSQGAAMALYSGLRYPLKLGGIVALSGYLPVQETFVAEKHFANRDTPIFMAHGIFDPVVPLQIGKNAAQFLMDNNYNVNMHTYSIAHTVIDEEIVHIGAFLRECLNYD